MKCKVVIHLFNSDCQYVCTISTKSAHIRFEPINNNKKQLACDKRTDKETKFIKFTTQTWPFWFFLNELSVSVFYKQCVIRYVNGLNGTPLVVIVQPQREVIDHDW